MAGAVVETTIVTDVALAPFSVTTVGAALHVDRDGAPASTDNLRWIVIGCLRWWRKFKTRNPGRHLFTCSDRNLRLWFDHASAQRKTHARGAIAASLIRRDTGEPRKTQPVPRMRDR